MRGIIFNNHEINEASRDRATNGKELKEEMKRKKKGEFPLQHTNLANIYRRRLFSLICLYIFLFWFFFFFYFFFRDNYNILL